jgi:hypothetical protein
VTGAGYRELQARLVELWPTVTTRTVGDEERTVVVLVSIPFQLPPRFVPLLPAYEERLLCLVLVLLRQPRSHVVYVTSQPVFPRLVDYWFGLVPELDTPEARCRLHLLSPVDGRLRPLTEKILARARFVERIREAIVNPDRSLMLPFATTPLEVELAVRLGIPVYGPEPTLARFGTKGGSRRLFAEEGIPHPPGVEGVWSVGEVVTAIQAIRASRPGAREVVVKLDDSVSGLGNAIVSLDGAAEPAQLEARARRPQLEDGELDPEAFYAALGERGGIVEERIGGAEFRSPSVQLRVSPDGEIDLLSTHDQVLGGDHGQTYLGCRMPADSAYEPAISRDARTIAARLAREGVIGRFGIDFVAVRDAGEGWRHYAVEINLRQGGTTHPLLTCQALTDGAYDVERGEFLNSAGAAKYYAATDHLASPAYASLTPDDLIDLAAARRLAWDDKRQVGVVFHMVSALAAGGFVGLTAIGDSAAHAQELYDEVKRTLDEETGAPEVARAASRGAG